MRCGRCAVLEYVVGNVSAISNKPPVVCREPQGEGEQPRSARSARIVLRQALIDRDEELLRDILEVGFAHPQSPERAADVPELNLEELAEIRRECRPDLRRAKTVCGGGEVGKQGTAPKEVLLEGGLVRTDPNPSQGGHDDAEPAAAED